jgi:hypothetical protein
MTGARLAEKKAAKRRRRENREAREQEKATRTGESPAQEGERKRKPAADARAAADAARRDV